MGKNLSIDTRLAKKYAKALLAACDSKKEKELVSKDILALQAFFEKEDSVLRRISSPYIPDEIFQVVLDVLTKQFKLQEKTVNLFNIMQENNRTNLIAKSMESYLLQYNDECGIAKVQIIADYDFSKSDLTEISKIITAKLNKEVVFDIVKDESIIAGFLLKINNGVTIDCTVNKYLESLRLNLDSQLEHIK